MKGRCATMLMVVLMLAGGMAQAGNGQGFVDMVDYPGNAEGWEPFIDLERRLDHDFDQICGDTFCEGDYSDYQPLRFRCSTDQASGLLQQCVWTFGASEISVEPSNGQLLVDSRTWSCPIRLPVGLTVPALYQSLAGSGPLFTPLPGGEPIYESLIDCL